MSADILLIAPRVEFLTFLKERKSVSAIARTERITCRQNPINLVKLSVRVRIMVTSLSLAVGVTVIGVYRLEETSAH